MLVVDRAFTDVLTWRAERGQVRIVQAALVGVASVPAIGVWAAVLWVAATTGAALIDGEFCRRLLTRPTDRILLALTSASLVVSGLTFSLIALPLLAQRAQVALAEAALIMCAINLNNAVMTRASRLGSALILGPSSIVLTAMPLAAIAFGHRLSLTDIALLEVGTVGYLVFIGRLAATLRKEGETVRGALEDQDRQRRRAEFAMEEAVQGRGRWRMLFDQSPLPQTCFNASKLHSLLRPHIDAGEAQLGDLAKVLFADTAEAIKQITMVDMNEAAETLFAVHQLSEEVDPKRLHKSFVDGLLRGLSTIDDDGVMAPYEAQIVRPGGELVDVSVHIRMPPGQDPPWSACMTSYVDMTDARRAARAQQAAVDAAETANRAKSEFLAIMSHEIRTPLNGVLGMAQAMELEPLEPAQKDRLGIIRQSGAALLEILNDVLDLSKIEAGKMELEIGDFDLGAVVRAARAAFSAVAARKGLELEVEIDPAASSFYRGDAVRVRQVIYNLIANAVKFTEKGAVTIRISPCASGVKIAVADTGIGIEPDRVPRLFEKFVQANSSTTRRFGGTGLGLAICRELSKAMGGEIEVASQLGAGSVFTVTLPLEAVERDETAAETVVGEPGIAGAPRSGRALRVLAAEDNAVNQLVLKTLLAQVGISPVIVANGAEAVAAYEEGAWDLILMDVQMPVMDGPTAARLIREREAEIGAAPTPIVALTANAMSHQVQAYRDAGMNGILAKPIEVAQLYETLAAAAPEGRTESRATERDVA